jgi:adenylate kinase
MICDKCGGPLYQRPDDNPEVIKKRIEVYNEQTRPIVQFFREKTVSFVVASADALETPPETVVEKIIEDLKRQNLA